MPTAVQLDSPARRIKQRRGRRTYDAFIHTGFKLLEHAELESISIVDLAKAAGYSVGAFYARFQSKDEFFDALIGQHLEHRTRVRDELFTTTPDDLLVRTLIEDLVTYYWRRRHFWCAALVRSIRDPQFWEPIRQHGRVFADLLIERMNKCTKRPLTEPECMNVRFAFQLALGTINNAILNRPGPIFIGQDLFISNLERAFRLVSDYDALMQVDGTDSGSSAITRPRSRR